VHSFECSILPSVKSARVGDGFQEQLRTGSSLERELQELRQVAFQMVMACPQLFEASAINNALKFAASGHGDPQRREVKLTPDFAGRAFAVQQGVEGVQHGAQISAGTVPQSSVPGFVRMHRAAVKARQVHVVHLDQVIEHRLVCLGQKARQERVAFGGANRLRSTAS